MPSTPKQSCRLTGCSTLCDREPYRPDHKRQTRRQQDEERGTPTARGYDADHRRLRVLCFHRDQWRCVDCGWEPDVVADCRRFDLGDPPAEKVLDELRQRLKRGERHLHADHEVPIAVRPDLRLELNNLRTLFIPEKLARAKHLPLIVHFHGAPWVAEVAVAREGRHALISVEGGSGSTAYAKQFADRELFGAMLREAEQKSGVTFGPVWLTAWSAGHGAIREILTVPEYYDKVARVLLIDGMHTGYVDGKPGPQESRLENDHLDIFLKFAQDAVSRRKTLLITHSEIFPGTFASTTETADWLLAKLGLHRVAVVKWGPMKTQQLSEVRAGNFRMIGYAGNSAPDHVDQFHSMPEYLKWLR